jgi:hypothetical protein
MPREAWPWIKDELDRDLADTEVAVYISGGAKGVDRMAERYVWGLPCPWTENGRWVVTRELDGGFTIDQSKARGFMLVVLPNYKRHGNRAPLVRNTTIAECCTRLIAFVNGKMSSGTGHATSEAARLGKLVTVHTWTGGTRGTQQHE